jgi:two-component system nitrogen regulation response regulator GlnG
MTPPQLLLVDDDPDLVDFVTRALEPTHLMIESAGSGEAALDRVRERPPELMLLDLVLPGIDGLETLRQLRREGFEFPVVLITSHGGMETTIQAMEEGAWDYLAKPLHVAELTNLVERCLRSTERPGGAVELSDPSEIVLLGSSPAMVELFKAIGRVAKQAVAVLLIGERGSGKRLVARGIHRHSGHPGPLLALDCAAMPETFVARELFGQESGVRGEVQHQVIGMLEQARQGTLLLEQVGDLALPLQGSLLHVLEERAFHRPGHHELIPLEARIIAATREGLEVPVAQGSFRGDLLSRLAEVTIRIPPLRERGEDVRLLTEEWVRRLAPRSARRIASIEPELHTRLEAHSWPGNVQELWSVLEQALLRGAGPVLKASELPHLEATPQVPPLGTAETLGGLEQAHIAKVLEEMGWNQSAAAKRLGIHRNTLRRKIREYGLQR